MKGSDNPFPSILIEDHVDPAAPANGFHRLFIDTDEKLKMIDHASLVTDFTPSAGGAVATDAIWDAAGDLAVGTGADTAGRLAKGAAGGVLAMGNSAVIWNAGTSFPVSKATGDRYWRTDLGLEFYWDGTRWVTTTLYFTPGTDVSNQTTNVGTGRRTAFGAKFDIFIVDFIVSCYTSATNDGSNYWTWNLAKTSTADAQTNLGTVVTSGDTAATWYPHVTAINAVVVTATHPLIDMNVIKTNAPGGVYGNPGFTYRLIAT
jgi:hypothetical protein